MTSDPFFHPVSGFDLPRFAGDELPASVNGQVLAVADRLDTLAGVFAIGKKPSGNRDPFGLRRAALGIIRVLVECELDLDLKALIKAAVAPQPKKPDDGDLAGELYTFIAERLRRYFLDRDDDPNGPDPRKCLPQGHHFHVLLPGGLYHMSCNNPFFAGVDERDRDRLAVEGRRHRRRRNLR